MYDVRKCPKHSGSDSQREWITPAAAPLQRSRLPEISILKKRRGLATTEPVPVELGTRHYWVEEFRVCSNESKCSFRGGDNNIIVEIHLQSLKIFFRTTRPLGTKYTLEKRTQCFTNKYHSILKKRWWNFSSPNRCYVIFHRFAHMLLLLWTVSQVNDVAHGPLLIIIYMKTCFNKMIKLEINASIPS